MNGFNQTSIKDKVKEIWYRFNKYIIISVCAAIIVLIVLLIPKPKDKNVKYQSIESIMVMNAKKYINNNNIMNDGYLFLDNLNIKIDASLDCDSTSGVYKKDDDYYPYLICKDYYSDTIKKVLDNNKENSKFGTLKGDNLYILYEGLYTEPGYDVDEKYAVNISSNDIEPGVNIIKYSILDDNKYVGELKRVVIANEVKGIYPTIELVGNQTRTIAQNAIYTESGYRAMDTLDGDITKKVQVSENVNTKIPGTYTVTYTVINSRNKRTTEKRSVIVNQIDINLDITHTLNPTTIANNGVTIALNIKGNGYSHTILPNNEKVASTNPTYMTRKNATYEFIVYDKNGNSEVYAVSVTNNDVTPPTGSCEAVYTNGITVITVDASDLSGIKSYEYFNNGRSLKKSNNKTYTLNEYPTEAKVKVIDNSDDSTTFTCRIKDTSPLEIHFIDQGRNDGILIRGSGTTIFIDGGLYSKGKGIKEYLDALGITEIDYFLGSHLDDNHIHAEKYLMTYFKVKGAYYNDDPRTCLKRKTCDVSRADPRTVVEELDKRNIPISVIPVGANYKIGNLVFDVVGPIELSGGVNKNSLNMILKYGNKKFYFSGDGIQDKNVLAKFDASVLDVDFFKYPHHGQATVTQKMINALTPEIVVFTHSNNNMPSECSSDLKRVGASIYYAGKHGNMVVTSDGNSLSIKTQANPSDYRR